MTSMFGHESGPGEHIIAAPARFPDEIVVPLTILLDFIIRKDEEIEARVAALREELPDRFSSSAAAVEHAGYIGIEAGRRLILNDLAAGLVAVVQSAQASIPAQQGPVEPPQQGSQ